MALAPGVPVEEQLPPAPVTISLAEVHQLLRAGLPVSPWDAAAALAWLAYQQRHKEAAYRSARKRTLQTLEQARAP